MAVVKPDNLTLLIEFIRLAEEPESISNELVAQILSGLNNLYREAMDSIADNKNYIERILGTSASEAIDNLNEIIKFLEGFKDDEKLASHLNEVKTKLESLINRISPIDSKASHANSFAYTLAGKEFLMYDPFGFVPAMNGVSLTMTRGHIDEHNEFFRTTTGIQFPKATPLNAGTMSADDKLFLDSIPTLLDGKQSMLINSDDIIVDKETHRLTITTQATRKAFDDLWLAAVGEHGKIERGHMEDGVLKEYYLNELWMTYEEAQAVMAAGKIDGAFNSHKYYRVGKMKTVIPPLNISVNDALDNTFNQCTNLLKIRIGSFRASALNYAFYYCRKLTHIFGTIDIADIVNAANTKQAFTMCEALEEVNIKNCSADLSFPDSSKLSAQSVKYLVSNKSGTAVITLTFHADVYAKITAGEGEWAGILDLAAEKNVSIASA